MSKQKSPYLWVKWVFFESICRTISNVLQKLIGISSKDISYGIFVMHIAGFVEIIYGTITKPNLTLKVIWLGIKERKLTYPWKFILGSIIWGTLGTIATILAFYAFMPGLNGDLGVFSFIIILGVVPGTLFDVFLFKDKISKERLMGMSLAIIAGYAALDFPDLGQIINLPVWVKVTFICSLIVSVNQVISRLIKEIDTAVKNFWAGIATLTVTTIWLYNQNVLSNHWLDFSFPIIKIKIMAIIIGFSIVGLVTYNIKSYLDGAIITVKKTTLESIDLILTIIIGIIAFKEPATMGKLIGTLIYIPAMYLLIKEKVEKEEKAKTTKQ